MRALLICPHTQTITEVEYEAGRYADIKRLIDAKTYEGVTINRENILYVDGDGMRRPGQRFWSLGNFPHMLGGKGLVLGYDEAGEDCEPTATLSQLKGLVTWARPDLIYEGETPFVETQEPHPVFGTITRLESHAVFSTGKKP